MSRADLSSMLTVGSYFYEITVDSKVIAIEESKFNANVIVATRRSADGLSKHHVEAALDAEQRIQTVALSYSSSLFTRKANYQTVDDTIHGRISGLAGRNEIAVQLGRFREVDVAGFLIFRALVIDHIRLRGVTQWTGRVAVIDSNTLVATSVKQNCARRDKSELSWVYEPRMGDTEEIELDGGGRIVHRHDSRGFTARLIAAPS
jgi:hypothetical protein